MALPQGATSVTYTTTVTTIDGNGEQVEAYSSNNTFPLGGAPTDPVTPEQRDAAVEEGMDAFRAALIQIYPAPSNVNLRRSYTCLNPGDAWPLI